MSMAQMTCGCIAVPIILLIGAIAIRALWQELRKG